MILTRRVDWILENYRDGDESGWDAEFWWLDNNHAARLWELAVSIHERGVREPIELGPDHRVWDGHHRLRVAHLLQIPTVPVLFVDQDTR